MITFLPQSLIDTDIIMRQVETTINQLIAEEQIVLVTKDNQTKIKLTSPVAINTIADLFKETIPTEQTETTNEISEPLSEKEKVEQSTEYPTSIELEPQATNALLRKKRQLKYGSKRWILRDIENLVDLKANLKCTDKQVARLIPDRTIKSINSKYNKCLQKNLIQYNEATKKFEFVGTEAF